MKTVADILAHLSMTVVQERLSQWEKDFTSSLGEQYSKNGFLSNRQIEVLKGVYDKHSPEKVKEASSFQQEFKNSKELQSLWGSAIEYYKQNPPYYGNVIIQAEANPDFIPPKSLISRMTENKYFERWLSLKNSKPVFEVGDLVRLSGQPPNSTFIGKAEKKIKEDNPSFSYYTSLYWHRAWSKAKEEKHMLLIQDICDYTFTSAKGSKLYKCLDISGDNGIIYLEERHMREAK